MINHDHLNVAECCIRDCQANAQKKLTFNERAILVQTILGIGMREACELCDHIAAHGYVTIMQESNS